MSTVLTVVEVTAILSLGLSAVLVVAIAVTEFACRVLDRPGDEGERAAVVSLDAWRSHHVQATPIRRPEARR